jgi:hypothetical protein
MAEGSRKAAAPKATGGRVGNLVLRTCNCSALRVLSAAHRLSVYADWCCIIFFGQLVSRSVAATLATAVFDRRAKV